MASPDSTTHLPKADHIKVILTGDVMIGRGIDQIMRHPVSPELYESCLKSAVDYVSLAERISGPIPRKVTPEYIWGDVLSEFRNPEVNARIINLETAATRRGTPWPGKGIHYRVNPDHLDCLTVAGIDCCQLANNHVLDWGHEGLTDTLGELNTRGIGPTGAGYSAEDAAQPTIIALPGRECRLLVWAFASSSSGVPPSWNATEHKPGVNFLKDLSDATVTAIAKRIKGLRRPGDVVVVGLHWGPNWGYSLPPGHQSFAHRLVDEAGVDVVHGHSSHHPAPMEIYHRKLILYGCGDLLNDYEGIGDFDWFRPDLVLLYVVTLDVMSGSLAGLELVPAQIRRFRLNRVSDEDLDWLKNRLDEICQRLGIRIGDGGNGRLLID